ncbi:Glutamyl-tRNA(Gln) amidotransferase subunit D [Candidatus Lokiarchaeum ossiferum]|uniref:Glutamyl-tRNA(Gln) amidotransferase subunit D n=1 Tax=Candidatus Lokiarchaeum ossiferum TaxID=2951803 RepID=A0ABY6HQZ2_9ARCH|nr:Glutamyl-tRNA(Gln) amidotransferase subunit D [Candidatus Lokiarchaeum sp. B-35]
MTDIIDEFEGYKPKSIKILSKFGAKTWSKIRIETQVGISEGTILPRNKYAPDGFVEIKLKNGYNIGIFLDETTKIEVLSQEPKMEVKFDPITPPRNKKLPNLVLMGTGGTISSRLDYVTGGVIPAFKPAELYAAVPELSNVCNLETEVVYQIFSENMKPKYWLQLAQSIAKKINTGVEGVLVAHGTDTLSYTSSALAFLLKDLQVPVVCVGSQRSSDRPSSDAAMNLINAASIAGTSDIAEVVVAMLGSSAHDYGFIHRGTRVRKMHSSARHAFRSIDTPPLGMIRENQISMFTSDYQKRSNNQIETTAAKNIEEKVGMVYAYPGMPIDLLDYYLDKNYKGIVIAGTGLGHVPSDLFKSLARAQDAKVPVIMTVQTLWGFTGMDVYENGREIQSYGVIPGQNMLPEVAMTKLAWILGNYSNETEITDLISSNIAGEITLGEPINGYQIYQGVESQIPSQIKNNSNLKQQKSSKKKKK